MEETESDTIPMDVVGVRIELPTNTPILLLRERDGGRFLPIWIGTNEATAIALATRTSSPVFAARAVLDEGGVEIRDEGQEEEIERFREFLEDITPDDFEAGQGPS